MTHQGILRYLTEDHPTESGLLISFVIAISLAAFVAYTVRVRGEKIDSVTLGAVGFLIGLVCVCAMGNKIDPKTVFGKRVMWGILIGTTLLYVLLVKPWKEIWFRNKPQPAHQLAGRGSHVDGRAKRKDESNTNVVALGTAMLVAAAWFGMKLMQLDFRVTQASDFISLLLVPVAAGVVYWWRRNKS